MTVASFELLIANRPVPLRAFSFARLFDPAYSHTVNGPRHRRLRPALLLASPLAAALLLWAGAAVSQPQPAAAVPASAAPAVAEPAAGTPEISEPAEAGDTIGRPDADDLRSGHVLIYAGGGVWLPPDGLLPALPGVSGIEVGGGGRVVLGIGLNRYVDLQLNGGFGYASLAGCDGCSATSIDAGLAMAFHPTQGFALDPWASFGLGYRHTFASHDLGDETIPALDFAKIGIGADYYPVPVFGFGPFLQTNIGMHSFDTPSAYATVELGLRFAFDPLQGGTSFTPGVAKR